MEDAAEVGFQGAGHVVVGDGSCIVRVAASVVVAVFAGLGTQKGEGHLVRWGRVV